MTGYKFDSIEDQCLFMCVWADVAKTQSYSKKAMNPIYRMRDVYDRVIHGWYKMPCNDYENDQKILGHNYINRENVAYGHMDYTWSPTLGKLIKRFVKHVSAVDSSVGIYYIRNDPYAVIDIDNAHEFIANFPFLAKKLWDLARKKKCFLVFSPGGLHFYFKTNPDTKIRSVYGSYGAGSFGADIISTGAIFLPGSRYCVVTQKTVCMASYTPGNADFNEWFLRKRNENDDNFERMAKIILQKKPPTPPVPDASPVPDAPQKKSRFIVGHAWLATIREYVKRHCSRKTAPPSPPLDTREPPRAYFKH